MLSEVALWRMNLNRSKCGLLTVTRNRKQVLSSYNLLVTNYDQINTSTINKRAVQNHLRVFITPDLKWNIQAACAKASRMLGFLSRPTLNVTNPRPLIRCMLYKTLVSSYFACSSQVWSPQYVLLILEMEKVQR